MPYPKKTIDLKRGMNNREGTYMFCTLFPLCHKGLRVFEKEYNNNNIYKLISYILSTTRDVALSSGKRSGKSFFSMERVGLTG